MSQIKKLTVDPYFILGVSKGDSEEHVRKAYKKKAKTLHPDKNPDKNQIELETKFSILSEAYNFILQEYKSESQDLKSNYNSFNDFTDEDLSLNNQELFNAKFNKNRGTRPEDFGYDVTERLGNLDGTEKLEKHYNTISTNYEKTEFKTQNLFQDKKFSQDSFNKMFEYNQQKISRPNSNLLIKSTDGFCGFNSGQSDIGYSNVASYNGMLIQGDNFGQSGVGFNGENYSDYKQSFNAPNNPYSLDDVPDDFNVANVSEIDFEKKLQERIQEQKKHIAVSTGSYKEQEEELIRKQQQELLNKTIDDKNLINEYKHLYSGHLLEMAEQGRLSVSSDYTSEKQILKKLE